jgi:putative hydrolase of the HAD superfamily
MSEQPHNMFGANPLGRSTAGPQTDPPNTLKSGEPTKPHVVVFDLGKVLLDFDYGIAAAKIAGKGKWLRDEVHRFIAQSPLLFRYETGLMTQSEFFAEICRATGYSGDLEEFAGFFSDIFSPIEPMVALQAELRKRGVPTYIFSNTNDLAVTHIRKNFPFFANFDGYVLSYECGAMKPDDKIYEAVEKMTGKRGPEILYLDDRSENVEAGAKRGWQVILQESPAKTIPLIKAAGLL